MEAILVVPSVRTRTLQNALLASHAALPVDVS